jgi:uncharacterized protein YqiB (DUF1249 family)
MDQSSIAKLALGQKHSLASLIELYESNYFRLLRLLPELGDLEGTTVSRVAGALDLYLTVVERFKYTTTLTLTYRFNEDDKILLEPNIRIRVYHDARAVEVLSHDRRCTSMVRATTRSRGSELERKWELNRFLHKWLGFCQRQGHIFLRCTAISSRLPAGAHPSQTLSE